MSIKRCPGIPPGQLENMTLKAAYCHSVLKCFARQWQSSSAPLLVLTASGSAVISDNSNKICTKKI